MLSFVIKLMMKIIDVGLLVLFPVLFGGLVSKVPCSLQNRMIGTNY